MLTTFPEFREYCRRLQGETLRTGSQGKPFKVRVEGTQVLFIPASGKARIASPDYTEKVLEELKTSKDWSPGRYSDTTYNSSYILGVAKHHATRRTQPRASSPGGIDQPPHTNDYCEIWGHNGWRRVTVASALSRPSVLARCIECKGAVRLHAAGPAGIPRAHAEHKEGHAGCSLGHYFSGVRTPHPTPLLDPQSGSSKDVASPVVTEDDESAFPEGTESYKLHRKLERDGSLPRRVKASRFASTGKLECEVCSFDFIVAYGELGEGFIEAHHAVPVSQINGATTTKADQLKLVCPNCHRMLHRSDPLMSVEELRALV